ncbi:hypothetical protein PV379_11000 [Streptomyces caniscabiei]|nr:hypothetical protein [Streptomyces caniscabiei]MDX2601682.1 hypothetical protein [Streptomyces caniscabiei]MDX2737117.1 hypothetical protein [Streptomyces caniscabiei]MDX2777836.1 hypothetical protein [Streptomyces caniscabiei]
MTVAVAVALGLPLVASAGPLGDLPASERAATPERGPTSELERAAGRVGAATGLGARDDSGDARGTDGSGGGADGSGGDVEQSADRADQKAGGAEGPDAQPADDAGAPDDDQGSSRLLGLGLATAARCGPDLTSPDGIEAQTCVLTQGDRTWARTYYRNVTGRELSSVLSMMAPGGHTVRIHCAVGAHDEPGVCETPRERTRGGTGAYTAVAEFAAPDGGGPLLLRSGSNSGRS